MGHEPQRFKSSLGYIKVCKKIKFGILEYIDLTDIKYIKLVKETLLKRELYYLDSINPSLNVCKKLVLHQE